MNEVTKLEERIKSIKYVISVFDGKINSLDKKIQKEYLDEESLLINELYESKDKLQKENERSKLQLNALEDQIPLAIKADAQAEMLVIEKELKSLLEKHGEFNDSILKSLSQVSDDISKGIQYEIKSHSLEVKASELSKKGARMKSNYHFESVEKNIMELANAIILNMRRAEGARNTAAQRRSWLAQAN